MAVLARRRGRERPDPPSPPNGRSRTSLLVVDQHQKRQFIWPDTKRMFTILLILSCRRSLCASAALYPRCVPQGAQRGRSRAIT